MADTYTDTGNHPAFLAKGASDRRARLSAFPGAAEYVYGPRDPSNIMNILHETNGVVFPYTPNINQAVNVQYDNYSPIHSNQGFYAYKQTSAMSMTVSGIFTAQNRREKEYSLAVLHFLRTVSKMRFGENDPMRGSPPPMLEFSAYGSLMYNRLPVIMENFQLAFLDSSDYVHHVRTSAAPGGGADARRQADAWIPSKFDLVVTLITQRTPTELRRSFSWERFRNGDLLLDGGWF